MRVPVAFRWLMIGAIGWLGWRGPIVARDFSDFRAALLPPPASRSQEAPPVRLQIAVNAAAAAMATAAPFLRLAATHGGLANSGPAPASVITLDLPPVREGAPAAPEQATPRPADGGKLAEQAYQRLRTGDRKAAAALLAAAAETAPADPRAAGWTADRRMLTQRWSGDAYVLVRKAGTPRLLGPTPALGGSQAGARLAYVLNPFADQRITLSGRIFQPLARHSGRTAAAQAVLGIELQPSRKLPFTIAIDRYAALGQKARNAWALRLSGGASALPVRPGLEASFYAQAGVIGARAHDGYADGWLTLRTPVVEKPGVRATVGAGLWAGAQPGASRVDIGPSAELSARLGKARVAAAVDYRIRAAGNARPGNGPAVTVRAGF